MLAVVPEIAERDADLELLQEGRALIARGEAAAALARAQAAIARDADSFGGRVLLGELALAKGAAASAEKILREALALRPADAGAARALASALLPQGKLKEAGERLIALVRTCPDDAAALILLSKVAERAGNRSAAEAALKQAVQRQPHDVNALRARFEFLKRHGRDGEAEAALQPLMQRQPENPGWVIEQSLLKERANNLSEAEQVLRDALSRWPRAHAISLALGNLLKRQGQLEEALIHHRRAAGSADTRLPLVGVGRRKALFVIQHAPPWPSLASIRDAFAADAEWEAIVVAMPFLHSHIKTDAERNEIFSFLEQKHISYVRWDQFELKPGCADVVFFCLPYQETFPVGWRLDDILRAVPRLVYIPYALVIVGGSENTHYQFNLPMQQRAWMIAAHGERNRAMYAKHCATGAAHVELTGHPKMDSVLQVDATRDESMENFAAGRRVVCWNPHFDLRPGPDAFGSGLSTFFRWQKFLVQEFMRRPGLALVIRPHPLFFSSLELRKLWTGSQTAEFLERVRVAGNIMIDQRPTYHAAFKNSAAMISDASSLLLEYAVTGKPLLYLRNPHGPELNDHGELIRDRYYTAETEAEITAFLDDVERGEDRCADGRSKAVAEFIHFPREGAAMALKRAVERRLGEEQARQTAAVISG